MDANERYNGGRTKNRSSNFGARGWMILITCFLSNMIVVITEQWLNYIIPAFSDTYALPSTTLYTIATISTWGGVIGLIVFGPVLRKAGAKNTMIISSLITIAALLIWTFAWNLVMYTIGAFFTRIGVIVTVFLGGARLATNWFPTKKGLFMGYATIGVTGGMMVTNIFIPQLLAAGGVHIAMSFGTVFAFVVLILVLVVVKNNPEEANAFPDNDTSMTKEKVQAVFEEGERYMKSSEWTLRKSLNSPVVWLSGISLGLVLLVPVGIMAQFVPAAVGMGLTAEFAQVALLIAGLLGIVASWLAGKLDLFIGTKRTTLIAMVIAMLGCLLLGMLGGFGLTAMIGIVLVAASSGMANNMIVSLPGTLFGRYDFTNPYQVVVVVQATITGFGFMLVSNVANAAENYYMSFLVCSAICFLSFILLCVMKDKYLGRTDEELLAMKTSSREFESVAR
jgi:MFS family permease